MSTVETNCIIGCYTNQTKLYNLLTTVKWFEDISVVYILIEHTNDTHIVSNYTHSMMNITFMVIYNNSMKKYINLILHRF